MLAETLDVAHVCALEAEDCLVVIANCHDVWIVVVLAGQIEQQSKLRQIRVLELVDHVMLDARPDLLVEEGCIIIVLQ